MLEHKDYLSSLNKARRKRSQKPDPRLWILILAAVLAVGAIIFAVKYMKKSESGEMAARSVGEQLQTGEPQTDPAAAVAAESDEETQWEQQVEEAVGRFANLGLIQVSGYVNIRETPGTDGTVLGTIADGGGCEVLGTEGEWTKIQSGGLEGYVSSQYLVTGQEAKNLAEKYVKLRAVITMETEGEKLRVRETPDDSTSDNVIGAVSDGESFEVLSQEDGWIQIKDGYISDQFAQVSYALEEGRKLDEKTKAINQYENLVMSKVNGYLNVRSSPEDKGNANIIGKMTSKAGGEILETLDGWYKVKSGPIVGYISSDPQYTATGREAKDIALQTASLKAVISTDVLNVRTEPSTDAKIWTQIVKDEKYPVIDDPETPDGWLKIDLDSVDEEDGGVSDGAYISTRDNNVEVRYVINEAIKFKPAESGSGGSGSSGSGSRRSQIVNYAIQFVGNPYVWGGTSLTNGVDCSGFTMKVMQKFGVSLPHYSGSQAKMGKKVTSGNMKPGDLIFYAGSNGRINHVALYIGNGQVVHAASRRSGIKISTWNYRSPVAIRNMLD